MRADSVLGWPTRVGVVDHLALQVRLVDLVVVDQAERADAGCGQVQGGRGAQAAGADQQHLGVEQLELSLDADLGQEGVPRIAHPLLRAHALGHHDGKALGLPCLDAAGDGGGVLVAELAELIGGARGAVAGGAVENHALLMVRDHFLDALGDVDRANQLGAVDVGLHVLVGLARVDQGDAALAELLLRLGGIELLDPLLDLFDRLGAGHQVVSSSPSKCVSASSSPIAISPSMGYPRSLQSFDPPMIEATFSNPWSF